MSNSDRYIRTRPWPSTREAKLTRTKSLLNCLHSLLQESSGMTYSPDHWSALKREMYVTRPLSLYNSAHAVIEPPVEPEGPGSGVLVIADGAAEEQTKCCWGTCKTPRLSHLPFPQNRVIEVRYTTRLGLLQLTYSDDVFFVPVINQPLSSNRYYVVRAHGKNKG